MISTSSLSHLSLDGGPTTAQQTDASVSETMSGPATTIRGEEEADLIARGLERMVGQKMEVAMQRIEAEIVRRVEERLGGGGGA